MSESTKKYIKVKSDKEIILKLFPDYIVDEMVHDARKFNSRLFKLKGINPVKAKADLLYILAQKGFDGNFSRLLSMFKETN